MYHTSQVTALEEALNERKHTVEFVEENEKMKKSKYACIRSCADSNPSPSSPPPPRRV